MLRPKEIVCRWVDAFNHHDVEAIVCLYHDNAVNHQVANVPVVGIDAIREMFTAEFAAADMTAIVENIFEDGQWAILERPLGAARLRIFSCCQWEDSISEGVLG